MVRMQQKNGRNLTFGRVDILMFFKQIGIFMFDIRKVLNSGQTIKMKVSKHKLKLLSKARVGMGGV